jgi:hypothetical protein
MIFVITIRAMIIYHDDQPKRDIERHDMSHHDGRLMRNISFEFYARNAKRLLCRLQRRHSKTDHSLCRDLGDLTADNVMSMPAQNGRAGGHTRYGAK